MPQNCSSDVSKVIEHVDKVLLRGHPREKQQLKSFFGLGNLKHDDDFARYATLLFHDCITTNEKLPARFRMDLGNGNPTTSPQATRDSSSSATVLRTQAHSIPMPPRCPVRKA